MLLHLNYKSKKCSKYLYFFSFIILLFSSCEKEEKPNITSISIKKSPVIIEYFEGDEILNLEGLEITLNYQNSKKKTIAFNSFSDNDIECYPSHGEVLPIGIEFFTITHTPSGKDISQPISVNKISVNKISIENLPDKTDYYLGEILDLTGIELVQYFNNGTKKNIKISDFETNGMHCSFDKNKILTDPSAIFFFTHLASDIRVDFPIKFKTVSDIDNNTYSISKIGNQLWLSEDLKTTKFTDGTPISLESISDNEPKWFNLTTPAYVIDYTLNSVYYNYYTIETEKICPQGWRVPTEYDWENLHDFLDLEGFNNTQGKALKSTEGWKSWATDGPHYSGENKYGFNALPTGIMTTQYDGDFMTYQNKLSSWWSSTKSQDDQGQFVSLYGESQYFHIGRSTIESGVFSKKSGLNIRCIKK